VSHTARRLLLLAFVALGLSLLIARFTPRRRVLPAQDDAARSLGMHAAIAGMNERLLDALQRSDAHAYARNFSEDAISMPGYGPIVRGREAIASAMAHTFEKLRFVEVDVATLDMRQTGETVLEAGRYRYVVAARESGERQTLTGRYVIVWKRVGDRWKIALDAAQPGATEV
jgi:uncharacterized protein (TIGR02246 family)